MSTQENSFKSKIAKNSLIENLLRFILVISLLYIFLVGVSVLGGSIKLMGGGFAKGLLNVTSTPLLGLFSGMFATVLFQSSSVTTAIIVGLVASSALPLGGAIPMIMGANLGTSVTNTLVSLGYLKNQKHFRDAFAAATVHDIFNILTVLVLFPLEMLTGFLEKSATVVANALYGTSSALSYKSPIKSAIKPVANGVKSFVTDFVGISGSLAGILLAIIAAGLIIFALGFIVRTMKAVVESNKGQIIENLLSKNGYFAIFFGTLLTIAVQSSSITTSLLVPMAGAGVLTLESILPVTIGANIGTTATALLAALTGNVAGLAIALVHFFFNILGLILWYVHPSLRNIPILLCNRLANLTLKNRLNGLAYILGVFFLFPFLLTILL
ncbi:MAG: Na/Pi symporter [Bacteriovoracaceae bacterium]|jgi:sodium-dependent phosphate cotransporter|nr:sodium dependent phosphate transporter [Halobacteriovoraceae bacterium]MDP7321053.1 Na/Pi symporter [Bacteriovoracaceae bacterium]